MALSSRQTRHEVLLRLIDSRPIRTQEELAHELRLAGIDTTQASLSRDLRALAVAKVGGHYQRTSPDGEGELGLEQALHLFLRRVVAAPPNLVVVQTRAGAAPEVGSFLDAAALPGVVGTVAGDDTVVVAVTDAAAARRLAVQLDTLSGRRRRTQAT